MGSVTSAVRVFWLLLFWLSGAAPRPASARRFPGPPGQRSNPAPVPVPVPVPVPGLAVRSRSRHRCRSRSRAGIQVGFGVRFGSGFGVGFGIRGDRWCIGADDRRRIGRRRARVDRDRWGDHRHGDPRRGDDGDRSPSAALIHLGGGRGLFARFRNHLLLHCRVTVLVVVDVDDFVAERLCEVDGRVSGGADASLSCSAAAYRRCEHRHDRSRPRRSPATDACACRLPDPRWSGEGEHVAPGPPTGGHPGRGPAG